MTAYDHGGKLTDQEITLYSYFVGPLQSTVQGLFVHNKEFFMGTTYDLNRIGVFAEIKPAGGMHFNVYGEYGGSVDYSNVREAVALRLSPFAELSLGRHVNINLRHAFERLEFEGNKIFMANLSQIRLIYNFNVRAFVRAIVQYLDVSRNPELYLFPVPDKTQTIFTQFLFSYKLNPQTVLFIGYSDNYLGMTGIDITQSDRTFFVKLGYAWTR